MASKIDPTHLAPGPAKVGDSSTVKVTQLGPGGSQQQQQQQQRPSSRRTSHETRSLLSTPDGKLREAATAGLDDEVRRMLNPKGSGGAAGAGKAPGPGGGAGPSKAVKAAQARAAAGITDTGVTLALFEALRHDRFSTAMLLAKSGGVKLSLTFRDAKKKTVLHQAVASDAIDVIKTLLRLPEAAKYVNKKDGVGRTALHVAASKGSSEASIRELLACGADIDAQDSQFLTPLHSAVIEQMRRKVDTDTAQALLEVYGAEVNTKNMLGDSPLHDAARGGHEDLIRLLLRNGADPDSVNAEGQTPQDLANEAVQRIFLTPRKKWTPRVAAELSESAPECKGARRKVCEQFFVTVRFYYRPQSLSWSQTKSVYRVVYVDKTLSEMEATFRKIVAEALEQPEGSVRSEDIWKWIHFPANNLTWVRDVVWRLTYHKTNQGPLKKALHFVESNLRERRGHNNTLACTRMPHAEDSQRDDDPNYTSPLASPDLNGPMTREMFAQMFAEFGGSGSGPWPWAPSSPMSPRPGGGGGGGLSSSMPPTGRFRCGNEVWRSRTHLPRDRRLSLVLPYFDFETERYLDLHLDPDSMSRQFRRMAGLQECYPPLSAQAGGLQSPQTLDQSYYDMLDENEMRLRNKDQVVYKWFKRALEEVGGGGGDGDSLARRALSDDEDDGNTDAGTAPCPASDADAAEDAERREQAMSPAQQEWAQFGGGPGADGDFPATETDRSDAGNVVLTQSQLEGREMVSTQRTNKLVMIHQLWLWKLDENTVVTTLPERWHTSIEDTLLETIRQSGINEFQEPEDLIEHILFECTHFLEEYRYAGMGTHLLDIFESSIATMSSEEVQCFKKFHSTVDKKKKHRKDHHHKKEGKEGDVDDGGKDALPATLEDTGQDISKEIHLIYEVKDIQDELHLIKRVFLSQLETIDKFSRLFWSDIGPETVRLRKQFLLDCGVEALIKRTEKLDQDAQRTLEALDYLVQVKQAQSSLDEAAAASELNKEAVKEAKRSQRLNDYILLFTTITVIFTPLSFMTSLFAIPIDSFPQDEENGAVSYSVGWFTWRMFAGEFISLGVIGLALYLVSLGKKKGWKKRWKNRFGPLSNILPGDNNGDIQSVDQVRGGSSDDGGRRSSWGAGGRDHNHHRKSRRGSSISSSDARGGFARGLAAAAARSEDARSVGSGFGGRQQQKGWDRIRKRLGGARGGGGGVRLSDLERQELSRRRGVMDWMREKPDDDDGAGSFERPYSM